jgi:hypothetical protein
MKLDNNVNSKTTLIGISPAKVIRGEPYYSSDELLTALPKVILNTPYFRPKAKEMTKDLELASEVLEKATSIFKVRLDEYSQTCSDIDMATNKASQQLRMTTEKLSQGLSRIEKSANFANLERYTLLLERSAQALSILADLEAKGQLEKISMALK